MLNQHNFNPAYAGAENTVVGTAVVRRQWVGLEGAPGSIDLDVHMPLGLIGGGFGLQLRNDKTGAHSLTKVGLSYSYWVPVGNSMTLLLGARAGIEQFGLDGNAIRTPEGDYGQGSITHNDPFLPFDLQKGISPIFDGGVLLKSDNFELGVSVGDISSLAKEISLTSQTLKYFGSKTINGFGSYSLSLGSSFLLKPTILFRSDLVEQEIHLSSLLDYEERLFLGASYRGYSNSTTDAMVIFAGGRISDKLKVAYAFDITLSELASVNEGSHEFLITYNLGKPIGQGKKQKIIYNPRF